MFCYVIIMGNDEDDCSKLDVRFDVKLAKLSYFGDKTTNKKHQLYS